MTDDRLVSAHDRIEAALARIERSARVPVAPPRSTGVDDDLAERHAALRESVTESLGQLDRLIAGLER